MPAPSTTAHPDGEHHDEPPRLAVVYQAESVAPLDLMAAASAVCRLVWVVDDVDPAVMRLRPLLDRLGPVVTVNGRSPGEVAAELQGLAVGGVATFAADLPLAAAIADRLRLRFHRPATAYLLTDKLAQRRAMASAGLPVPIATAVPAETAEWPSFASRLRYPVVCKPREGLASRATSPAASPAELLAVLAAVGASAGPLLVEDLIEPRHPGGASGCCADVLMVDSLVRGGRPTHLAVVGHFPQARPFRGTGSFAPAGFDDETTAEVLAAVDAALAACAVDDSFTNTDVMLTPDGCRVIEVNGRIGGEVPALFHLAGQPGLLAATMCFALGDDLAELRPLGTEGVAFSITAQPEVNGVLQRIDGLDDLANMPQVRDLTVHAQPGDHLDWRAGTGTRLLTARGLVADHAELARVEACIRRTVRAVVERGA